VLALVLVGLFFTPLAGCADPDGTPAGADPVEPEPEEALFAPEVYAGRFRAGGLVLETPHTARNCAATSRPRCPRSAAGPTSSAGPGTGSSTARSAAPGYGWFELVGTYDGKRFTLTEPPGYPYPHPSGPVDDFRSPCSPPAGGWQVIDDATATEAALQEAIALASSLPGGAGVWIDQNGGENDPKKLVLNARFIDDLPGNEARLRDLWGGALCVSPATRTTADLTRVQAELATLPGVLSTGIDTLANQVTAEVYVATDARRQELAARYGPDTVVLTGFLEPVRD